MRKSKKRKASTLIIDDLDNLQIRCGGGDGGSGRDSGNLPHVRDLRLIVAPIKATATNNDLLSPAACLLESAADSCSCSGANLFQCALSTCMLGGVSILLQCCHSTSYPLAGARCTGTG
jgi:hypothetical protein